MVLHDGTRLCGDDRQRNERWSFLAVRPIRDALRKQMSWFSIVAIYFVLWWLILFVVLPFSLRTQDEEGEVTLGTEASAPHRSPVLRIVVRTTVVAAILFVAFYVVRTQTNFSFDDIPRIPPKFD